MKMKPFGQRAAAAAFALMGSVFAGKAQGAVSPPNYTVTTPANEFEYFVNGTSSGQPAQDANVDDSLNFTLNAGATYIFSMNARSIHPVDICTNSNTTSKYAGASSQKVSSGTVTLAIPATEPTRRPSAGSTPSAGRTYSSALVRRGN